MRGAALDDRLTEPAQDSPEFDYDNWEDDPNFVGFNLRGGRFVSARLKQARFIKCDLRGADFRSSDLRSADFCGSDLRFTDFTDANLASCRFRACDLRGATIALEAVTDDLLKTASDLSATAGRTLLTLLAGCLYVWITLGTTTDAALIANSSTSPLPIVATELPIVGFFWLAPLMLCSIFLYLLLSLQRLWETLADLPAYLPDGKTADRTADTWFFSGMLQANFQRLRQDRPILTLIENALSRLLIWGAVPLTIAAVWLRYLPRHDWVGTGFLVTIFALAVIASSICYGKAVQTLRPDRNHARYRFRDLLSHLWGALPIGALVVLSLGALQGPASDDAGRAHNPERIVPASISNRLASALLGAAGYRNFAALGGARLSAQHDAAAPGDNQDGVPPALAALSGPSLRGIDLRNADGPRLFAPHSDLGEAFLDDATLWEADLRLARLDATEADGANFSQAKLSYANLLKASLARTILWHIGADHICGLGTSFASAILEGADLSDATLINADFTGAYVKDMKLAGADLSSANFTGAHGLTAATLAGACGHAAIGLPAGTTLPECLKTQPNWCHILAQ
jgi:uncharacterized protein YjbI with pentapeptide repeats